ncbi:MAG: SRPBCC family protein [Terriglobia bacterium]
MRTHVVRLILGALILWGKAMAQDKDIALSLTRETQGAYCLDGTFRAEVPTQVAWEVLTDYDHVGQFVSSVRLSHVKDRWEDGLLLEQETVGGVLFFTRRVRVLLTVREEPYRRILFEDTEKKNFRYYSGFWVIEEAQGGVAVHYVLKAEPNFSVPDFIAREIFRKMAARLLKGVGAEMLRRSKDDIFNGNRRTDPVPLDGPAGPIKGDAKRKPMPASAR